MARHFPYLFLPLLQEKTARANPGHRSQNQALRAVFAVVCRKFTAGVRAPVASLLGRRHRQSRELSQLSAQFILIIKQ
jgi:hypothetical protein